MSDYTPTTPVIRGAYVQLHSGASWESKQPRLVEFDRWLEQVKAEAWDEGHRTPQEREPDDCQCGAWYDGECGCGLFGTGEIITPNPYRQKEQDA